MVALLPDPDSGAVGRAVVSGLTGSVELAEARASTVVAGKATPTPVKTLSEADSGQLFTDVLSALPGSRYGELSGTSMATPHVSGAAALLWDAHPRSTATTIRKALDAAVVDLGTPGRDPEFGFGRLDLSAVTR